MMRQIFISFFVVFYAGATLAEYTLYDGEHGSVSVGMQVQTALFTEFNNQQGGPLQSKLTDVFYELGAKPYLNATLNLPESSSLYGGYSYVFSSTLGHDASGLTLDNGEPQLLAQTDFTVLGTYNDYRYKNMAEEYYLGWKSGKLFEGLGENAIDISGGRQNFKLGSGFLLFYGSESGGFRGGSWINQRTAFNNTAIGRFTFKDIKLESFHLETRPINPAEKRTYDGGNLEYKYSDNATFGISYINTRNKRARHPGGSLVPDANEETDNDAYDVRADFSPLTDLNVSLEYVYQINRVKTNNFRTLKTEKIYSDGGFGSIEYKFSDVPWQPVLGYRYAIQDQGFDTFAPGFSGWGSWFQGEITGEFVLYNTNLISNLAKLVLTPREDLTLSLLYFNFRLVDPQSLQYNITANDYGNEVNLLMDWQCNDSLALTAGIEAFVPGEAAKQYFDGGNQVWVQGILAATYEF